VQALVPGRDLGVRGLVRRARLEQALDALFE
jgi:hypothetical protein